MAANVAMAHQSPEVFAYFHVELADQSLIFAEGAPAEPFPGDAERGACDNWAEHEPTHDGTPVGEPDLPRASFPPRRASASPSWPRLQGTVAVAA